MAGRPPAERRLTPLCDRTHTHLIPTPPQALNEWNLKETDWRKKLDQSRASVRGTLNAAGAGARGALGLVPRKLVRLDRARPPRVRRLVASLVVAGNGDWPSSPRRPPPQMLLTEAKNNKNKMARWTVEALLSGAEALKWGYVSRAGPRDNTSHVVLNVQVGRRQPGALADPAAEHCIRTQPRGAPQRCAQDVHAPAQLTEWMWRRHSGRG